MKRRGAFTCLELVIVLGLVAVIVCLTGPLVNQSSQRMAEQRFWQSFRQEWHLAQTRSQLYSLPTSITHQPSLNAISFVCDHHRRLVPIPATLHVDSFAPIDIRSTGYVHPETYYFHSDLDNRKYRLVIQMARGEYDVKEE